MRKENNQPIPFEQEFPEEAGTLMTICANDELRQKVKVFETNIPKSERMFPKSNLGTYLRSLLYGGGKTYKRSTDKVNRNDPCPGGSGKKYMKCCYS